MKRSFWFVLAAFVLGVVAGYVLGVRAGSGKPTKGSTFLREFSFEDALREAAAADWEIVHDRTESVLVGASHRTGRRFVAHATLDPKNVQEFAQHFDQSIERALPHQSGESRIDFSKATTNSSVHLQLPRYHYRVDGGEGIIDAGIVADDGEVTVSVSMLE